MIKYLYFCILSELIKKTNVQHFINAAQSHIFEYLIIFFFRILHSQLYVVYISSFFMFTQNREQILNMTG